MIDDRDRRIVRQHSQEMALRYAANFVKPPPTLEQLKEFIDHFDNDAYSTSTPASQPTAQRALGDMSDEDIAQATGAEVTRIGERIASEKQQKLVELRAKNKKLTKGAVKKILVEHAKVESLDALPMSSVDAVLEAIGQ